LLGKISVPGFEPKTAKPGKEVTRKIELRNKIRRVRCNLPEIRRKCKGKNVNLKIKFFLSKERIEDQSKYNKDLDNLLKITLDVLPKYMDKKEVNKGLGIIEDDNSVYAIHAEKILVNKDDEQGIDIEISLNLSYITNNHRF